MLRPWVAGHVGREEPVQISVVLFHGDEAVGGEQDGAVEGFELLVLVPPGTAVIALEMIILLEGRIIVGRQHLAVGVDVDARPLRLLEQLV